ncbi:MAG: hypothetical protein HOP11_05220 [Saprospiraceae bacterium]|nr:hypothetical protein [Saprospiraceae bacterium]
MNRPKILRILLFVILLSKSQIEAQQVILSPEIDLRSDFAYYLIPLAKDVVLIRDKAVKVIFQKLDSNLNWSTERELQLEGKKWNILDAYQHNNNIGIIYTCRIDKIIQCYYTVFDNAGNKKYHRNLIDTLAIQSNENISFQSSENKNFVSVGFRDFQSNPYVFVYERFQDSIYYVKNVKEIFNFNNGFAEEAIVTNQGELYLKAIERNPIKSKIKYIHKIIGANSQGEKIMYKVIESEFEFFSSKLSYRTSTNQICFVGLCQEAGETEMIGYAIQNLSKNEPIRFTEFDEKKIKEWTGRKNNNIYSNNNLQLRNVKFQEDGSAVIFIESVKQYLRRPYFGGANDGTPAFAGSRWIDYYFDDVLVSCIREDGVKNWETILRKKQFSQDDEGINSSFFIMNNRSFLRILFNDEIKNESTVSEYILLADGKVNRKSILNTSFKKINLRIRDAIQIDAQSVLIPSENNGRLSLLRMIL